MTLGTERKAPRQTLAFLLHIAEGQTSVQSLRREAVLQNSLFTAAQLSFTIMQRWEDSTLLQMMELKTTNLYFGSRHLFQTGWKGVVGANSTGRNTPWAGHQSKVRVSKWPNVHVLGRWQETGVPGDPHRMTWAGTDHRTIWLRDYHQLHLWASYHLLHWEKIYIY